MTVQSDKLQLGQDLVQTAMVQSGIKIHPLENRSVRQLSITRLTTAALVMHSPVTACTNTVDHHLNI